jgi:hypothetical protein
MIYRKRFDRFVPPSASPARRRQLHPPTPHVVPRVGCVYPTARRLPVKATPCGWRSAPLPSAPRQP